MSSNVLKFWSLLESLSGETSNDQSTISEDERIKKNIELLQKSLKLSQAEVVRALIEDLDVPELKSKEESVGDKQDVKSRYCIYILMTIRNIYTKTDFQSDKVEDLVSEYHKGLLCSCLEDIVENGLKPNLHPSFREAKNSVFGDRIRKTPNFWLVKLLLEGISPLIHIKSLPAIRSSDEIILCYMAAVFTLVFASQTKECDIKDTCERNMIAKLNKLWNDVPKAMYFRNIMMIYGVVAKENKPIVHREMLMKLWSPGGFVALLFAMHKSENNEGQSIADVVVKLVSQPSYPKKAQESIVNQILRFLKASIENKDVLSYMGIGLGSLRKLYENNEYNRVLVKDWLMKQIQPLLNVQEDCITVMEWSDFSSTVHLLFQIFCTSTVECMPSDLLIPYIPILITCYQHIDNYKRKPSVNVVLSHLSHLLLRVLNNRTMDELNFITKNVVTGEYPKDWLTLHCNIKFEEDVLNSEHLKIVQRKEENQGIDPLMNSLAELIKNSTFSSLAYKIFIVLFRLFSTIGNQTKSADSTSNIDLLISNDDIQSRIMWEISNRYNGKIQVINALQILVEHKPIKSLLVENIKELLMILQDILSIYADNGDENNHLLDQSVVVILLTLMREIMENSSTKLENIKHELLEKLLVLETKTEDKDLKLHIGFLKEQIQGENTMMEKNKIDKEKFEEARSLVESKEPYRQVEGIQLFISLIRKRDEFTISNVHVVTALALRTLTSPESYTFLNCVRLFVALVYFNEHMILETLTEDYLNESASMDYRLLVGEVLLKVCHEIGPLCYKYKNILLNCYMYGCRSPLDEFRFSSFSNLAQICKILSYDVYKYFQELLDLINCELTIGKYMPAKRAAVMVLSELLSGMDNLMDFQEMLLPIYRLLKALASSECVDEKIRVHASVGLETLAVKCKELLLLTTSHESLKKEIHIRGIKSKPKTNLKNHILYMN
ncbi:transport and golgi organization 6 [Musca autumnalis]|uniref:transport and golgi organization 6 n=1 Tax=Musca autumnalis TaxID=221902 RepID=UPI003CF413A6